MLLHSKRTLIFLAFFLSSGACFLVNAQFTHTHSQIKFRHLGLQEGLSQSSINCIMQDSRGFMWLGTQDGLNVYDGYTFKVYNFDPLDSNSLTYGYINCLYEDNNGIIWIGTNGWGLNAYDTRNGKFKSYRYREGDSTSLGNDDVLSIIPEKGGNLWIRTFANGVSYFEPSKGKFTVYRHDDKDSTSISSNVISYVLPEKDGTVWFGTRKGLSRYDPTTRKFKVYRNKPGDPSSLAGDRIELMVNDNSGNLLIGTWDAGVCMMDLATKKFTRLESGLSQKEKDAGNNYINCLLVDRKGQIWAGSRYGLMVFDPVIHKATCYLHKNNDKRSLSSNSIKQLLEDHMGKIWVGTAGGLNLFNPLSKDFNRYEHDETDPYSLSDDDINKLFEDQNNTLWIGTSIGLNFFSPQTKRFKVMKHEDNNSLSLASSEVWSMFEDHSDNLWIGSSLGLNKVNSKTGEQKVYLLEDKRPDIPHNYVVAYGEATNGIIWMGTNGGGVTAYDPRKQEFKAYPSVSSDTTTISSNSISNLVLDKSGQVWVGNFSKGIDILSQEGRRTGGYKYDKDRPNSISSNDILQILPSHDGSMWVTTSNGFNNINPATGKVTRYLHDDKDSTSLLFNNTTSVYEDKDGSVWVGTFGGGLNHLDVSTGKFTRYTEHDALPNNVVYGVLPDDQGHIWLSTNKGLCRFTPPGTQGGKAVTRNFDEQDGLPSNEFNGGSYFKSLDGHLYFGSVNGLVSFHPDSLSGNPMPSPVYITSFKIFEKELPLDTAISYKRSIRLNYKQNFVSFEFVTLNFVSPEKNQYAYKLEGVDREWIYCGNRRYASYTSLDPGEYTFRVKASNNDGVWNETGNHVHIVISPPFWKTKWFYGTCLLALIAGILGFTRLRTYKLRMAKKVLEGKVRERTTELKETNEKLSMAYTDIKDSIQYAKRIQEAILPLEMNLKASLPDSFVLFKPRDIVSGDFYWYSDKGDTVFVASCDCTGHGVPGAFMSLIGSTLMNEIVNHKNIDDPASILEHLHIAVRTALKQDSFQTENRDGMDVALCAIHKKTRTVEYAGAMRPLYIVKGKTESFMPLEEYKADKYPIGGIQSEERRIFHKHTIKLAPGDIVYMFSDGYPDQFGGEKGKKITNKRFKEFLMSIHDLSMAEQERELLVKFENWKGQLEQVDDVLVIGIKV